MKSYFLLAGAVILSACGGSISPNQSASTGFATSRDDITNASIGTVFKIPSSTVSLSAANPTAAAKDEEITVKVISGTEVEVTRGGQTEILAYNLTSNSYTKLTATEFISAYLSQLNQYASTSSVVSETYDQNGVLQSEVISSGIIGYKTDPSALPATANYAGTSRIGVFNTNGDSDVAFGTANLNANFGSGSVTGSLVFSDPLNDGQSTANGTIGPSASVDLGNFTMNVNGSISGNQMSIPIAIAPGDIGAASIAPTSINGGFFGPNGEFAAADGIGLATSTTPGASSDLLYRTVIDTARQ